jgi:hypothetical protein
MTGRGGQDLWMATDSQCEGWGVGEGGHLEKACTG